MNKPHNFTVSIYGIGNFGFALLKHFDNKKDDKINIQAFDRNKDLVINLEKNREHLFFHKNIKISSRVNFCDSPESLITNSDILILAVSSDATRQILKIVKEFAPKKGLMIVNTAKALENHSGKRLSEIAEEELKGINYSYSLIAGGTIAKDLFRHEPLGMDMASQDFNQAKFLAEIFSSENLNVYPTDDLIGVEYASALKNVVSILAGIINGLGLSYGSETHVISRTAELISKACTDELGAKEKTFTIGGQSWGNDLWMSCTGKTRNREFGIMVGKGTPVADALAQMAEQNKIVEGINTIRIINKIKPLAKIPPIALLYDLIVKKNIEYSTLKKRIFENL